MREDVQTIRWASFIAPTPSWACVVIGSKDQLRDFMDAKPRGDVVGYVIAGQNCQTREALFDEWAAVLGFPGYFGKNWAAFTDCMSDMGWSPSSSYVVSITDMCRVLPDDGQFQILLDALESVAKQGARTVGSPPQDERPAKVTFLFHAEQADTRGLASRLGHLGIPYYGLA